MLQGESSFLQISGRSASLRKNDKTLPFSGGQMCEKTAISARTRILKTVEKFQSSPIFSTNKQYVKIKLMQNETNHWSIFL